MAQCFPPLQFYVLRVDSPAGVGVPGGSYVTVESGPHDGLHKAYTSLTDTDPVRASHLLLQCVSCLRPGYKSVVFICRPLGMRLCFFP